MRQITLLAAALVVFGMIAGCGGGSGSGMPTISASTSPDASPSPSPSPIGLANLVGTWSGTVSAPSRIVKTYNIPSLSIDSNGKLSGSAVASGAYAGEDLESISGTIDASGNVTLQWTDPINDVTVQKGSFTLSGGSGSSLQLIGTLQESFAGGSAIGPISYTLSR